MRGPDAMALLQRALHVSAAAAGLGIAVREASSTPWASATFAGARHVLTLSLPDQDAAHGWLRELAEAELPMRGHLLADCVVVAAEQCEAMIVARVEALSVEER